MEYEVTNEDAIEYIDEIALKNKDNPPLKRMAFWVKKAIQRAQNLEQENRELRKRVERLNDEISELNERIKELKESHKVYFMLEDPSMGHNRYTVEFVDGSMKVTKEK